MNYIANLRSRATVKYRVLAEPKGVGLLIGIATFVIIGAFHPVVIKAEYHFGKKCWPVFMVCGVACVVGSLFVGPLWASAILAVLGFTLLWSIKELFEQEKRVKKGWFPANPKRADKK